MNQPPPHLIPQPEAEAGANGHADAAAATPYVAPYLQKKKILCRFFVQGKCRHSAEECDFSHDRDNSYADPAEPRGLPSGGNNTHQVCRYYRMGNCRSGDACRFIHSDSAEPATTSAATRPTSTPVGPTATHSTSHSLSISDQLGQLNLSPGSGEAAETPPGPSSTQTATAASAPGSSWADAAVFVPRVAMAAPQPDTNLGGGGPFPYAYAPPLTSQVIYALPPTYSGPPTYLPMAPYPHSVPMSVPMGVAAMQTLSTMSLPPPVMPMAMLPPMVSPPNAAVNPAPLSAGTASNRVLLERQADLQQRCNADSPGDSFGAAKAPPPPPPPPPAPVPKITPSTSSTSASATVTNPPKQRSWAEVVNPAAMAELTAVEAASQLCPYGQTGECRYGQHCAYIHGEVCDQCGQAALHPTHVEQRSMHKTNCLRQHEVDMEIAFAVAKSKEKTCGICMEVVLDKSKGEARFGILPNCNHCFCLSCLRKWRQAKQFEHKIIRACPECRQTSDYICPSRFWVDSKEEKDLLLTNYRKALTSKECKYFQRGEGECPFGNKCFYRHASADGKDVDVGPPQRRPRRTNADGELTLVQRMLIYDFLEEREGRLVLPLEYLDLFDLWSDSEESDYDIL